LVADIDTGDVYAEKNAREARPIASVTKLMTALVANEIISFDRKISVPKGTLVNPPNPKDTEQKIFVAETLVYPLLMQSSNGVADALASYYGTRGFVAWMNTTAKALDMHATTFADASGASANNISMPDDLFRLAVYLANKKSFVLKVTHLSQKTITDEDGAEYKIKNVNTPAEKEPFEGGKAGHTTAAKDTMLSVVSFEHGGKTRRVAVIVLGSPDQIKDTSHLAEWVTTEAKASAATIGPACIGCTTPEYRKIEP
jgi:D-alanyl-D-alanine carboxypeptidase